MLILGIDTSCDDTSASLLEIKDSKASLLTNIISSQADIHRRYGGIVPELASRRHIEMIWPVVNEALSGMALEDISAVAVCYGPGLIGSLLVGCSFAKAICYSKGIPLVGVNHMEGHLLSVFLEKEIGFPFISLIASGGHTSLYLVEDFMRYKELGRTRDDAAGEAFDKVSKLLGLGYPGGPIIDRLSREGDPKAVRFPRAYLPGTLDFSFSGIKTAVRLKVEKEKLSEAFIKDISASFQQAVIDVLVRKTEWAIKRLKVKRVTLSGGVAANSALRKRMSEMAKERGVELYIPSPVFCTDNAAMIAYAGYRRFLVGQTSGLDLNPKAYLSL